VKTILAILRRARGHFSGFALAALLVSLGTGASLIEPWIYRAIVDDVAGVFVTPRPVREAEQALDQAEDWSTHFITSAQRMFHAPLRKHHADHPPRRLPPRTSRQAVATVILGAALLVVTRVLSELARLRGDMKSPALASEVERRYVVDAFRHVLRLPLDTFARRSSGAIARQVDQSDHVAPILLAITQEIWPDVVSLVFILVIVFTLNAELGLVILIAIPAYALVTWRMMRKLETRLDQYYSLWDDVSARIQQTVAGIKTILALGNGPYEVTQIEKTSRTAFGAYLERNRIENRYVFAQSMVINVSNALALLLGGMKALEHQLTPGDVVLFVTYLSRVYDPIESLTALYTSLQEHVSSLRRAEKLLAIPEASGEDLPALRPGPGAVEFRDVRFGYRPERLVLDGVSFSVRPGERVGLIGPSGAGKTTLTDLLVGLYRPVSGTITIDGQSLTDVSPSSLRAHIRGVAADGMLFRTTLAENIRYGRLDAGDADVAQAAAEAGLQGVIERLPDGLATEIGERGFELSAGERQRVLLARAFLARPTILILDEATANLDFRSEAAIKAVLHVLAKDRTTFIIAHRRSMLTEVDRVLVLLKGRIAQDGRPAELLEQPGFYRDMMTAQDREAAG